MIQLRLIIRSQWLLFPRSLCSLLYWLVSILIRVVTLLFIGFAGLIQILISSIVSPRYVLWLLIVPCMLSRSLILVG